MTCGSHSFIFALDSLNLYPLHIVPYAFYRYTNFSTISIKTFFIFDILSCYFLGIFTQVFRTERQREREGQSEFTPGGVCIHRGSNG